MCIYPTTTDTYQFKDQGIDEAIIATQFYKKLTTPKEELF